VTHCDCDRRDLGYVYLTMAMDLAKYNPSLDLSDTDRQWKNNVCFLSIF